MNRHFYTVIAAQTLSSVADHALFIAAIALIQNLSGPDWMAPVIKWWVAASYVLLAAFVGAIADSFPKGRVMFTTNAFKMIGCVWMFCHDAFGLSPTGQIILVCIAYAIVGMGATAYSPAKYGIITEMLPPSQLVKGNSWIEGMTVVSIIMGTVLGGFLISPYASQWLLEQSSFGMKFNSGAEAAIFVIGWVYLAAAFLNLLIPNTHIQYPAQPRNPVVLIKMFSNYVGVLWKDKLGQISLAVTTLFWGAGATLQLIVIEWGRSQLGYRLDQTSILMGIAAVGTVVGAALASRLPLQKSLKVLPMGVAMGLVVLLMPLVYDEWLVYLLLLVVGGLSGYFVVPMNALLQHRGHLLLSAGHSIAVQNFNEQLNILFMLFLYALMLWLDVPINTIIFLFGLSVACLMLLIVRWNRANLRKRKDLLNEIGHEGFGRAL
ncbi:lysophospholipid transporter LplT [Orrella sp. NBD-18]|uniref:Lysophospholipid transporter LplT n=1 Tax=Sheuella amnicola TaxID=2707330 RepID=A0A6B2QXE3_9BURK|nr:lysophospholipid transporter LplT [Sheuella amnicola]NDY82673.1 lysophospholipid transporter LplT [Sheuella amnicola]